MISGGQIRAGRALLGISGVELGRLAQVSWPTIQRFESVEQIPPSRTGTLERVKLALEEAGIEFIGDPIIYPGVRLRR